MEIIEPYILPVLTLIVAPLITSIVAYLITSRKVKRDFHDKALQNRYYKVYCPLRNLLLETHITGASTGYFFRQRLEKALHSFKKFKFKEGFRWLNKNYVTNQLYEVEFGKEFPLKEIKEVIKKDGKWADSILISLIQSADRAGYEKFAYSYDGADDGLLEKEKFELAEHIWNTYEKLNKRLLPSL
jgi:hypothetical protein